MRFTYSFPAVKGIQASREYYISMVPMKLLSKLFPNDDSIIPPEYRAQRKINETRIPEIKNYIIENRKTYVFSALSASINGNFKFVPSKDDDSIGVLNIDMSSVFLINDGQHRKRAIEAAIEEDESLGNDTISIVFFKDLGLKQSQQMFTDLNKHAVKTSNSLSTLYDYRDAIAVATKEVVDTVQFFSIYTDKERDILGKNSSKLFTLNNMYKANSRIINKLNYNEDSKRFLIDFWSNVSNNIFEWQELANKTITKRELREDYIITLAITINAFGKLGRYFYDNQMVNMNDYLIKLKKIDWLRSNKENWQNRVMRDNGKVMNNEEAITLTCIKIKQLIGLKLLKDESAKEQKFCERYK